MRRGSHEARYRTPVSELTDRLIRSRRLYAFRRIQRFLLRFACFGGLREGDPRVRITSKAMRAAAVRLSTPSLVKMCSRCFATVRVRVARIWPISALAFPSATHASTSFSRRVSRAYASANLDRCMTLARPRRKRSSRQNWWCCFMTHHRPCEKKLGSERQAGGGARPGPHESGTRGETSVVAGWRRPIAGPPLSAETPGSMTPICSAIKTTTSS